MAANRMPASTAVAPTSRKRYVPLNVPVMTCSAPPTLPYRGSITPRCARRARRRSSGASVEYGLRGGDSAPTARWCAAPAAPGTTSACAGCPPPACRRAAPPRRWASMRASTCRGGGAAPRAAAWLPRGRRRAAWARRGSARGSRRPDPADRASRGTWRCSTARTAVRLLEIADGVVVATVAVGPRALLIERTALRRRGARRDGGARGRLQDSTLSECADSPASFAAARSRAHARSPRARAPPRRAHLRAMQRDPTRTLRGASHRRRYEQTRARCPDGKRSAPATSPPARRESRPT